MSFEGIFSIILFRFSFKNTPDFVKIGGMKTLQNTEIESLKTENTSLKNENTNLKNENSYLKEQLDWFQRQVFGRKSERYIDPPDAQEQPLPGFELEPKDPPKEKIKVPEHERKKKRKKNNAYQNGLLIPDDIPVEQLVIDLPEEKKICPDTGLKLVCIGEEVTRKLAHKPGQYFVKEFIRLKYASPLREEFGIKIEELPDSILPKSRIDESLLAEIVTRKFSDHLPLYRLAEIFSRDGVQITRQLLSQWMIRLGKALLPLYFLMLTRIKESGLGFIDETPVNLQVKGKGKLQKGYMWVLVGGGREAGLDPPYRVYQFFPNRRYENASSLLEDFVGFMHSDKYGAYVELAESDKIIWQPCWGHIRRKFEEAKSGDQEFRKMFLQHVRYLYMFEKIAWSRSKEERIRIRKEKEGPIIDKLITAVQEKFEEDKALPKSKFKTALTYFYGCIKYLKNYHLHPDAHMDNMVAERAHRPLAIGRKNWLFVGSLEGGQSTAVLLSLVQTCRGLGINPREYLEDIMRRFFSHPANKLWELLPDEWAKARGINPLVVQPLHKRSSEEPSEMEFCDCGDDQVIEVSC